MTTGWALRPPIARRCSAPSIAWTKRATRTTPAPDWGSPSPGISPGRTAATLRFRTAPWAACAPPCAFRSEGLEDGADPARQFGLRTGADLGRYLLAILENHQGRNRTNPVFPGHARILVDVELGDLHLAVHFGRDLLERRRDHPAGPAPFGPKIDDYGFA